MKQPVVLASSSPYRRALLDRLGIPFECDSPDIDENTLPEETPEHLVARLSEAKARAVALRHPESLVIGSDQVALIGGRIVGKPGTHENAVIQLRQASGSVVRFLTGLSLYNAQADRAHTEVVPFDVHFRTLSDSQIDNYLRREEPYDCAGSFKSEGFGITLFDRLQGDDPNTLIGLPLIRLVRLLEQEGVNLI